MNDNAKQAIDHLELLEASLRQHLELISRHLEQVQTAKKLILCSAQLPLIVSVTDLSAEKQAVYKEAFEEATKETGRPFMIVPAEDEVKFICNTPAPLPTLPIKIVDGYITLEGDSINKQLPKCQCAKGLEGVVECAKTCLKSKAHCMEVITYAAYDSNILTGESKVCPACESNPCICQ